MRKIGLYAAILFFSAALCGCAAGKSDKIEPEAAKQTAGVDENKNIKNTAEKISSKISVADKLSKYTGKCTYITRYILKKDVMYFITADEEKHQYRLYRVPTGSGSDSESNIIISSKKILKKQFYRDLKMYTAGSHILIYCNVEDQLRCLVYDLNLNMEDNILVNVESVNAGEAIPACILPDQKKVVYYTDRFSEKSDLGGFYETDYNGKNKKILFKYNSTKEGNKYRLNEVYDMIPSDDGRKVYFTGGYSKKNSDSDTPCYGEYIIKNNSVRSYEGCRGSMIKDQHGGCVFTDQGNKTPDDFAGNLIYLDPDGRKVCSYEETREGMLGGISDYGNLYYSCDADEGTGKVKIYKKDSGKKIFEMKTDYYIEDVFIFEKQKKVVFWEIKGGGSAPEFHEYDVSGNRSEVED